MVLKVNLYQHFYVIMVISVLTLFFLLTYPQVSSRPFEEFGVNEWQFVRRVHASAREFARLGGLGM
jgi:hypothetical protein